MMFTSRRAGAQPVEGVLIPMGGGYADLSAGVAATFLAHARNGAVKITVLPTTYAVNPLTMSQAEVEQNLRCAERRCVELEAACRRVGQDIACTVAVAPIFTRRDAQDSAMLAYFGEDVTGVFVLGGDQRTAMQVLAGTLVEDAIVEIYTRGGVIAGTSAGGAIQSRTMIADYSRNFATGNALDRGAADVWDSTTQRGLAIGAEGVIFDQHFFQRGRLGRLLEAVLRPTLPHIGVGIDAYTGVHLDATGRLADVFGLYTVAVLDVDTYGAAQSTTYTGDCATVSARNVLVHLLAPGSASYDIPTRTPSLAAPPDSITRTTPRLELPPGAGPLFLTCGLARSSSVWDQFLAATGAGDKPLLIASTGFANEQSAWAAAKRLGDRLDSAYELRVVSAETCEPLALEGSHRGIIVRARDQSLLEPSRLSAVKDAWLSGVPLLLDGAAAALAGAVFSANAPTPAETAAAAIATQHSFLAGRTAVAPGLGLIEAAVEPHLLTNNRWGRLFSLAYTYPNHIAFGLSEGSAIVISQDRAVIAGENAALSLDLRHATLALGTNDAFVIANGLLDVFAPGDEVRIDHAERGAHLIELPMTAQEMAWLEREPRTVNPGDASMIRAAD